MGHSRAWLGRQDSNPNLLIQSQAAYRLADAPGQLKIGPGVRNRTSYPHRAPALQAGSDPTRKRREGGTGRGRTATVPIACSERRAFSATPERRGVEVVDPRRIERPFPLCRSGVLPLDDRPVVQPPRIELGPAGLQPAVRPLTLELRKLGSPTAIRTQICGFRDRRPTG